MTSKRMLLQFFLGSLSCLTCLKPLFLEGWALDVKILDLLILLSCGRSPIFPPVTRVMAFSSFSLRMGSYTNSAWMQCPLPMVSATELV